MKIKKTHILVFVVFTFFVLSITGCSSSSETGKSEDSDENEKFVKHEEGSASEIIYYAGAEQNNEMYSSFKDTSYLYWLDDQLLVTYGATKCNIFALNVLHKSGYKTPDMNTLCRDLFDTAFAADIMPVIGVNTIKDARTGDLIIWNYHMIIFESEINTYGQQYALAWWAGTSNEDNGDNIINNVCHGKYPLNGEYVVRRPVKIIDN